MFTTFLGGSGDVESKASLGSMASATRSDCLLDQGLICTKKYDE